jgi:hypothetical protein
MCFKKKKNFIEYKRRAKMYWNWNSKWLLTMGYYNFVFVFYIECDIKKIFESSLSALFCMRPLVLKKDWMEMWKTNIWTLNGRLDPLLKGRVVYTCLVNKSWKIKVLNVRIRFKCKNIKIIALWKSKCK